MINFFEQKSDIQLLQNYKNIMFGKIKITNQSSNNNNNKGDKLLLATKKLPTEEKVKQPFKHKIIQKAAKNNKQHKLPNPLFGPQKNKHQKALQIKKTNKIHNSNRTQSVLEQRLKGSKFRLLNQLLYTNNSQAALEHFKEHSEDFQIYHEGFRSQASKWQLNPMSVISAYLIKKYLKKPKKNPDSSQKLILDLGCGEGELSRILNLQQSKMKNSLKVFSVRSFDLVASRDHIEVADMAHLPIENNTADVCIFCLSLMGTNYLDFILEARRVLKKQEDCGELLIAEVQSRSERWQKFIRIIQKLGFKCFKNTTIGKSVTQQSGHKKQLQNNNDQQNSDFFRIMYFRIDSSKQVDFSTQISPNLYKQSNQVLKGCLYKRR